MSGTIELLTGWREVQASGDLEARLREAAEAATRESHAPYSECPSEFAVADSRIYARGCLESAAYNPTRGRRQARGAAGAGTAVAHGRTPRTACR